MISTSDRQYMTFVNYSSSALPSNYSISSAKQDSLATIIKNRTIIYKEESVNEQFSADENTNK